MISNLEKQINTIKQCINDLHKPYLNIDYFIEKRLNDILITYNADLNRAVNEIFNYGSSKELKIMKELIKES